MLDQLRSHEWGVHSQGGEDGVLSHVFECIGAESRFFVEFGAWDGQHWSNTAWLRRAHGFRGLLMDADPERVSAAVRREIVTAENADSLFRKYDVPAAFDLLSIDIDGNEYWVWEAIREHRPRVVVIEYNVFFSTDVSKTIPYDPAYAWDKSMYHGASLAALRKLGRRKGYSLVHTDSYAPNAVFVEERLLPRALRDLPIGRVASWDWDPGTEPKVESDRAWIPV